MMYCALNVDCGIDVILGLVIQRSAVIRRLGSPIGQARDWQGGFCRGHRSQLTSVRLLPFLISKIESAPWNCRHLSPRHLSRLCLPCSSCGCGQVIPNDVLVHIISNNLYLFMIFVPIWCLLWYLHTELKKQQILGT